MSGDPVVRALAQVPENQRLINRLTKVRRLGVLDVVDKTTERDAWRSELLKRVDGRGMVHFTKVKGIHEWITNPKFKISGGEFVKAMHVRCSTLKTPARAARVGNRGSPAC